MHWYWIDRITVFRRRQYAEAIKTVTLAEDHLHDHFQYHPVMPASLIIEGLAQTSGLLVGEAFDYKHKVVLAKIPKIVFHQTEARPGETLIYSATVDAISDGGAMTTVSASKDGELMAEGELVFAFLSDAAFSDQTLFDDGDLLKMMRVFRAYEVAVDENGQRLKVPTLP